MEYKDYITDFSSRAKKVLEEFSKCDPTNDLNVTALLSVATSSFVIPFERLKESHPFKDKIKFDRIVSRINIELKKNIPDSKLINNPSQWMTKNLQKDSLEKSDFENGFGAIKAEDKIKSLINTIRNALAHGNIYSCSKSGQSGHIDTLYFISKKSNEENAFFEILETNTNLERLSKTKKNKIYNDFIKSRNSNSGFCIVECPLSEFHEFLNTWIGLLSPST